TFHFFVCKAFIFNYQVLHNCIYGIFTINNCVVCSTTTSLPCNLYCCAIYFSPIPPFSTLLDGWILFSTVIYSQSTLILIFNNDSSVALLCLNAFSMSNCKVRGIIL